MNFHGLSPPTRKVNSLIEIYIENPEQSRWMVSSSDWILLTRNRAFLGQEILRKDMEEMPESGPLWTDDFSSLFSVVEFDD